DMSGVTPYITLAQIAARMKDMNTYDAVNEALDEVEYLFEVIPPELQDPAETLIAQLREKLKNLE
ncbi:MAG: hypothetical protein WBP44_04250, partial [Gammaproteobacteria bacterium]